MLKNTLNLIKSMNITLLACSPRQKSNTFRLAKAIQNTLKLQNQNVSLIDFAESDIALSNQGALNPNSTFQKNLISALQGPGLVFFLTPEYNWMPSAESMNFINRFAGNPHLNLFDNKVFAVAGISAGRGGRMPAVALGTTLNKVIGYFDLNSFVSGKIFEAQFVPKTISDGGELLDNDAFNQGLFSFIDVNLNYAKKWTAS